MKHAIIKFYEGLQDALVSCPDNDARIKELDKRFLELSKTIFNGHFCVNNEYEIHPLDIEFYFHQEGGNANALKEPQMYHKGKDLPFFPQPFSICPNRSGVDVAFENKGLGIRASFLIRGYEYIDKKPSQDKASPYINMAGKTFAKAADGSISEQFKPQYLWEDLFGNASMENSLSIVWKTNETVRNWKPKIWRRVNVKPIPGEIERLWRFSNIEYMTSKA